MMQIEALITHLIQVKHADEDMQRRGALLILICGSFLVVCVCSAPLVLLRGIGDPVLSGLVLGLTTCVVALGLRFAKQGKVTLAGAWTALGLSILVHLSVIASGGVNIFLYFATLTPLVMSQVARLRYVVPNVALNIFLVGVVMWQVPNFAGGADMPRNFFPVLILMHLCTGLLSYSVSRTNTHFFDKLLGTQEDLRAAEHRAIAANKAKSTFLANMSHELRTPLNAIIGYAEILLDESEDDEEFDLAQSQHDIEKIRHSGKHLLTLINSILDLAKVEAGKMQIDLTRFPARDLIEELYATALPLVEERGNTLKVRITDDLDQLHTDRTKLFQVLLNLLSNAAKFTTNGQITLSVLPRVDGRWDWHVEDEGIGIARDVQAHIFEDFVQASTTTTREYGGTGLGLSLCVQLTKLLQGELSLESEPGVGSRFTVTIPHELAPLKKQDEF